MKSGALYVHWWGLALADFGSNPRSGDSLRGRRYFVSGEVNNAQFHQFPVGHISQNLNTTTSIGVKVKTLGT